MSTNSIASIIAMAAVALSVGRASAQSTAFAYQGRLENGGAPATGVHDFRFRLFDAASGGAQVGATQCIDNLAVSQGLFTATVDFGPQFTTPAQRFIEIDVRADSGLNCSNATGFETLAPRQPITPAPLATHAKSAFSLAASDGAPATAVLVDSTGNVGIGSAAPLAPLHVAFPAPLLFLQDSDNAGLGQVGLVSFRDSAAVETGWLGFGSSGNANATFMNNRAGGYTALGAGALERLIVTPAGSVGIGTASPLATLEVRGNIRFGSAGQFSPAAGEENLRIIRGVVNFDGAILIGSGFTVSHPSVGRYTITFNTPFTGAATVTATAENQGTDGEKVVQMNGVSSASATVVTRLIELGGGLQDITFHFIAVGPR